MKVVQEIGGRISEALKGPASCDELVTDENGRVWLIVRGPEIAPGEPRVIVRLPDNGREPLASSS